MDGHNFNMQVLAGILSSLIFMTGTLPMLLKAFRSKDLKSYSASHLVMSNIGNTVHWVYISSLPLGPIWILHGFSTLTAALMLVWYLRYEVHLCLTRLQGQARSFFRHASGSAATCDPR
jgi:uncharacterized protein with PQ loop repeat